MVEDEKRDEEEGDADANEDGIDEDIVEEDGLGVEKVFIHFSKRGMEIPDEVRECPYDALKMVVLATS